MRESRSGDGAALALVLLLIIATVLLVVVGGGAFFIWQRQRAQEAIAMERQAMVQMERAEAVAARALAEERVIQGRQTNIDGKEQPGVASNHAESVESAIREVLQMQQQAWNAGDIEPFLGHYWKSEELTFSSGGKLTRSWQSTLENFKTKYPTKNEMGKLVFDNIEVSPLGPEAAFVLGEWQLNREPDKLGGNFTLVFRRLGGRWVIVHDHTSLAVSQDSPPTVLEPGAKPTMLQERGAGEGPAWHPELGLLTSGDGHIMRRARDGAMSIYLKDAGSNGLLFDRQGRLVICEPLRRRVSRQERDGQIIVLAENFEGKRFNQPNDLTIDSRGRIYFTDPQYGGRDNMELLDDEGRKVEGVYRIDLDGRVSRILTHEVDRPNGIVVTADDRHLFVADNNNNVDGGARKLWRFVLKDDGTVDLTSQTLIHDWKQTRGPDGIKLDSAGNLFVAAGLNKQNPPFETQPEPTAGVYVFSPNGKLLEFIPIPRDECTNCAFGGDDLRTLYVTAGGTLWSVRVRLPGRPVWPSLNN